MIFDFSRQDIIVKILFPVDIIDGFLQFFHRCEQRFFFYRENFFTLRNGGWTFEAVGEIFFHFRQRHAAALQAAEALDPFDVAVVENAVIVAVAFYVRDEAFFAVKFQGIRRYYATACLVRQGLSEPAEIHKQELIMNQLNVSSADRPVVAAACAKAEETGQPAMALELPDGRIVTGKTSSLLGPSAALMLNALKELGGINDEMHLLSPIIIEPIQRLKVDYLGNHNPRLHSDEILIALSICAATNPTAALAMQQLSKLRGCEAHASVILSRVDENVYHKLGVNLTCEPKYQTKKLYHA